MSTLGAVTHFVAVSFHPSQLSSGVSPLLSSLSVGRGGGWLFAGGALPPCAPPMRAREYELVAPGRRRKPPRKGPQGPAGAADHPRFGRGHDHADTIYLAARPVNSMPGRPGRLNPGMCRRNLSPSLATGQAPFGPVQCVGGTRSVAFVFAFVLETTQWPRTLVRSRRRQEQSRHE